MDQQNSYYNTNPLCTKRPTPCSTHLSAENTMLAGPLELHHVIVWSNDLGCIHQFYWWSRSMSHDRLLGRDRTQSSWTIGAIFHLNCW